MKVLVACEESQTVCKAFRDLGYEAWSCDILDPSGNMPEYHIKGDALKEAYSGKYDLMIAHPPCTYLSKASARWMFPNKVRCPKRYKLALEAKTFFMALLYAPIKHIAVENPTPLLIMDLPDHDQVIQPYEYGHPYSKRTLLWLKNLPPLKPTNIVPKKDTYLPSNTAKSRSHLKNSLGVPVRGASKSTFRSKTFEGIAKAMASQWSEAVINY